MDLFELWATLGIDTAAFTNGINAALGIAQGAFDLFVWQIEQLFNFTWGFMQDTIETGMGFDEQMSAVQAVLGSVEGTEENMIRLRAFALEQARESIFTSEETAQAYYYMGMAGWDAEQMLAGLPGIMNLAAASGEDLKMTSDMVTDSLTAFGLGAGQASHFADVLAQTATNANTDVARMQQTFKYLAPIAGQLGYSLEDVAISVGLIADSGIKGSMAGTTLRNIWTRIATDAGATKKDLGALQIVTEKLGVSFYDSQGRARPWLEVLEEMREAWGKLDPEKIDIVTQAFGSFASEGASADEVMAEFASDLDTWTTEWNSLTTEAERKQFVQELAPQFRALGISFTDSSGRLREFNQVAQDARVMLGGLSDEESIYYAKQIGSLRGISGFLSLMTASKEDFDSLKSSINGAKGAAEAMAGVRLDNLAGDVKLFNASLDVLRIAIFDDIKAPMREVVQWASTALNEITDAINENGLAGGLDVLGTKIEEAAEKFTPMLESIGKAAAPVFVSLFETVLPELDETIGGLGRSLASGLLSGISEEINDTNPLTGALVGIVSSFLRGGIGSSGSLTSEDMGTFHADLEPTVESEKLQAAIDAAVEEGALTVEVGGFTFSTDYTAAEILDALRTGGWDGSVDDAVSQILGDVGITAGYDMAENVGDQMKQYTPTITQDLAGALSGIGPDVGDSLSYSIDDKLRQYNFRINVQANVTGGQNNGVWSNNESFTVSNGQEFTVPRSNAASGGNTIIMTLNGTEVGRAFLPYIQAEQQRVGVSLSKGGTL